MPAVNEFGYPRFYQPTFDQPPKTNLENAITSLHEQRLEEMVRECSDITAAVFPIRFLVFPRARQATSPRELPCSRPNEQQRVPSRDNDRHPSVLCRFVQPQFFSSRHFTSFLHFFFFLFFFTFE